MINEVDYDQVGADSNGFVEIHTTPAATATMGGRTYNLVEGTALRATVEDSNTVFGSLIHNPNGKDTNDACRGLGVHDDGHPRGGT